MLQPPVGHGLLIVESSRSHSDTPPLEEWSARRRDLYLTIHNTHKRNTSMSLKAFEPAIPASQRPQTHALDRAATGIGSWLIRDICIKSFIGRTAAVAVTTGPYPFPLTVTIVDVPKQKTQERGQRCGQCHIWNCIGLNSNVGLRKARQAATSTLAQRTTRTCCSDTSRHIYCCTPME